MNSPKALGLTELAKRMPMAPEAFMQASKLSEADYADYGASFLRIIQRFIEQHPERLPLHVSSIDAAVATSVPALKRQDATGKTNGKPSDASLTFDAAPDGIAGVEILNESQLKKSVQKDALKLCLLLNEINELSERIKGSPLFRPTTRTQAVLTRLPTIVVQTETSFKDWIEMMYLLLYEASGGASAQFPVVNKANDLFKARWEINRLRNQFAHDNASSPDAKDNHERTKAIYESIIAKPYPTSRREWASVQIALLNRASQWLGAMLQCIKG